jgi:hypothetical protein
MHVGFVMPNQDHLCVKCESHGRSVGNEQILREGEMTEEAVTWQIDVSYASPAKFKKHSIATMPLSTVLVLQT